MLQTHRSLEAYCATLWWWLFFSFFRVMEHQWNESDSGKPKYSKKNLSQYHVVHHKSHMDWNGIEPGASAVTGRRLTAWAMARPIHLFSLNHPNFHLALPKPASIMSRSTKTKVISDQQFRLYTATMQNFIQINSKMKNVQGRADIPNVISPWHESAARCKLRVVTYQHTTEQCLDVRGQEFDRNRNACTVHCKPQQ